MREDLLDTAVYYATELGWPIFLCQQNKKPYPGTRGFKDATTDAETLERLLWRHPDANIASPAGIQWDVLDIDDSEAASTLRQHGVLPMTVRQKTPGGPDRIHYFWKHHDGITNRKGHLPNGIDVRGEGGYVLLPPSTGYQWLDGPDEREFAQWPDWLLEIVRHSSNGDGAQDWEPLDVEAIFDGVPKGERDDTAYRYACSLRSRDCRKAEALSLMTLAWKQMEQPARDEFPLDQALEKVHRAYERYRAGKSKEFQPRQDTPLVVRTADLSRARPVSWAWHRRIPIGYLSLLLGAEGVGKGTFVAWLIAQLTKGTLSGDLRGEPVHVAIIGDEDSFDDVWGPRLHVAGADLSYVHAIERPDGGYIDFASDHDRIGALVEEWEFALVYLDQMLDNLGVKVDDWRSKHVRDALRPARLLARELDLAVFAAMHPNKRGGTFRELVSGAVVFNAVSRSSLMLSTHPEDIERRVLVRGKGNLSAEPSSVEFDIVEKRFEHDGQAFRHPAVANLTSGDLTIDDLVGAPDAESTSKASDARDLIIELLPNDGKWHPARAIYDAAKAKGIDGRTVQKAKYKLGVIHRREGFQGGMQWKWPLTITVRKKGVAPR